VKSGHNLTRLLAAGLGSWTKQQSLRLALTISDFGAMSVSSGSVYDFLLPDSLAALQGLYGLSAFADCSSVDRCAHYCSNQSIRSDRFATANALTNFLAKYHLMNLLEYGFAEPFPDAVGLERSAVTCRGI
jgi:hypothetical protein